MEITAEIKQKLRDALSSKFERYVDFEARHAIDKKFNNGDRVSVVGVPEIRGVVTRVVMCDGSMSDSVAVVSGIPDFSAILFCALEHAPDDDGVTRYHTESGEVFAECGTPTEPCEASDAVDAGPEKERLSGDGGCKVSEDSPGTPPMERIKSGIMMLEYLQAHWGSLNRILNAVQECPNAFGTRVGQDCFASAADYLEAKAAEYRMATSHESFGVSVKQGSLP